MSARRLGQTHHVMLLAAGESKQQAVAALAAGRPIPGVMMSCDGGIDTHPDHMAWSEEEMPR